MRSTILADFERDVQFVGEDAGPFIDRVIAEVEAEDVSTGVLGGLHGDFASLVERDLLEDLSDVADELVDRGFIEDFLQLASYGTDSIYYIPWMQATYIMVAARRRSSTCPTARTPSSSPTSSGRSGVPASPSDRSGPAGIPCRR